MRIQRLHYTAIELASLGPRAPSWPAVSISLLCVLGVVAAPGLITAMNLYFLTFAAFAWFGMRTPIERPLLRSIAPLGGVLIVGLLGGAGADRYLYLKDAWYCLNPAVLLAVGFVLGQATSDVRRGLRAFVVGGVLVASLHLLRFALNPQLFSLEAVDIRGFAGTGYNAAALGVLLLLGAAGRWRERLGLHPAVAWLSLVVCATSVSLSFSRTMLLVVSIGLLAMAGTFAKREWLRMGGVAIALALAIATLHATVDTDSAHAKRTFVGKLARSFDELQGNDRMSVRDINENWRGFETQRAVQTWKEGSALQWVFGRGFGFQVDLQMFQNLSNTPGAAVRFIPIFHNGYVYLLVKSGVVGVMLYGVMLGWLYFVGRRDSQGTSNDERRYLGRLMQACSLILAVTTWIVAGAFNKFDMLPFIVLAGFLLNALARVKPQ